MVSPLLQWRVRGARAGRHGRGGDSDGRRPPDTGQGPGGPPVRAHGGDRPEGCFVQRSLGVVPLRRFGGVRRRCSVHRRPVLGFGDKDPARRQRQRSACRETAVQRAAIVVAEQRADRPNTHHGHVGECTARPVGHKTAVRRRRLKDYTYYYTILKRNIILNILLYYH